MNVTLSWCLVLVPPGWWNVIICTNRKQTGLWVSGYCLFSLSQAQQHWEPDVRLTRLLFRLSTALESCVRVSSHWNADTGEPPLRCLWHLVSGWWSLLSSKRVCKNKETTKNKFQKSPKANRLSTRLLCWKEKGDSQNIWFQSHHVNPVARHKLLRTGWVAMCTHTF